MREEESEISPLYDSRHVVFLRYFIFTKNGIKNIRDQKGELINWKLFAKKRNGRGKKKESGVERSVKSDRMCESLAATDKSSGREGEEISYLTLGWKWGKSCLEEGGKGLLAAPFLLGLKKETWISRLFCAREDGWGCAAQSRLPFSPLSLSSPFLVSLLAPSAAFFRYCSL